MDFSQLQERYGPILKQYAIPIALGLFGLIFLGYGLISSLVPKHENQDILSEAATDESVPKSKPLQAQNLAIDIEGAVLKPGVYKLSKDARVQDALISAGGLSDKADREKVSKGLNLASKVIDGGKIYIPFVGESVSAVSLAQVGGVADSSQSVMGESTTGMINVNTASSQELDSLPGVGAVTAGKIISNRPYGSVDELLSKKVVGASVYGKIKDKISIN